MFGALTSLTGGGGISAGGGGPSTASTGDASAGMTNTFQYNAGFSVGGSGKLSASQESDQSASQGGNQQQMILYIALGVGGLIVLLAVLKK